MATHLTVVESRDAAAPVTVAPERPELQPLPQPMSQRQRRSQCQDSCSTGTGSLRRKSKYVPRSLVQHNYRDRSSELPDGSEGYVSRGGVATLFPLRLFQVLDQLASDGLSHLCSWQPHGRAFVVHRQREFEGVMHRYFGKMKFSSLQRQLNLYGFMRLSHGPDRGGYYHEYFLREREYLCHRIQRIRIKGNGARSACNPDQEPNFYAMKPVWPLAHPIAPQRAHQQQSPPPASKAPMMPPPQRQQSMPALPLSSSSSSSIDVTPNVIAVYGQPPSRAALRCLPLMRQASLNDRQLPTAVEHELKVDDDDDAGRLAGADKVDVEMLQRPLEGPALLARSVPPPPPRLVSSSSAPIVATRKMPMSQHESVAKGIAGGSKYDNDNGDKLLAIEPVVDAYLDNAFWRSMEMLMENIDGASPDAAEPIALLEPAPINVSGSDSNVPSNMGPNAPAVLLSASSPSRRFPNAPALSFATNDGSRRVVTPRASIDKDVFRMPPPPSILKPAEHAKQCPLDSNRGITNVLRVLFEKEDSKAKDEDRGEEESALSPIDIHKSASVCKKWCEGKYGSKSFSAEGSRNAATFMRMGTKTPFSRKNVWQNAAA